VANKIEKDLNEKMPSIAHIILKGDRVELIPVKDGVKVMKVTRKEVKG
jgi:hypothetical protein